MKKKVLAAVVALAIAAVAVINMDLVSRKQEALSALHLANIEALAQGESGGGGGGLCSKQCKRDRNYTCITPYGLVEDQKCAD